MSGSLNDCIICGDRVEDSDPTVSMTVPEVSDTAVAIVHRDCWANTGHTPLADEHRTYCGCCGREIMQGTDEWCIDCLREHIDTNAARPEDRTWFAQHGTPCPLVGG